MAQNTAQAIIEELRAAGASDAAIRGILANVKDESQFNPALRHPDQPKWGGEAHYAHGLYQEGGQEWNNYAAWLKENGHTDWTDPRLQTRFLAQNLQKNYPDVWEGMNKGSPEQAAQAFVNGYLKPAKQYAEARTAAYGKGVPEMDTFVSGAPAAPAAQTASMDIPALGPFPAEPANSPTPFQSALNDFNTHMGGMKSRYTGFGQPSPTGGAGAPAQTTPQQQALLSLLKSPGSGGGGQANYGGIPSPNYAGGGPSNGTSNMLNLMMQNKQQGNVLALMLGQGQGNNGGAQS